MQKLGKDQRKHAIIVFLVGLFTLVLDQLTKVFALLYLDVPTPRPFLGSAITLHLIHNPGAAFSMGTGHTWVFSIVAIVVVGLVAKFAFHTNSRPWAITLGLVGGGALGNLVDRLIRPPYWGNGHVIDFIDYFGWFVGNVADIAIVVAGVMVVVLVILNRPFRRPEPEETA